MYFSPCLLIKVPRFEVFTLSSRGLTSFPAGSSLFSIQEPPDSELLYQLICLWFQFFTFALVLKSKEKKSLHWDADGFWTAWIKLRTVQDFTNSCVSLRLPLCVCVDVHARVHECGTQVWRKRGWSFKSHQWGQVIKSFHSANLSVKYLAGYSKPVGCLRKLKL